LVFSQVIGFSGIDGAGDVDSQAATLALAVRHADGRFLRMSKDGEREKGQQRQSS